MIRHFDIKDLEKINVQDEQKCEDSEHWYMFDDNDTIVFEDGDRVLAIVRPLFQSGGKVHLVALVGKDCGYKAVPMFRKIRKLIDEWLSCKDINRVEMTTQLGFEQADRLAELLGFKKEGILRKYYNGIDFNIWGRTE